MFRNEEVDLIAREQDGKDVKETTLTVFAAKKSVSYKEFYAAKAVGMTPQLIFEVGIDDFNAISPRPTMLTHNGTKYNILRTYEKISEGIIEVVVA